MAASGSAFEENPQQDPADNYLRRGSFISPAVTVARWIPMTEAEWTITGSLETVFSLSDPSAEPREPRPCSAAAQIGWSKQMSFVLNQSALG